MYAKYSTQTVSCELTLRSARATSKIEKIRLRTVLYAMWKAN